MLEILALGDGAQRFLVLSGIAMARLGPVFQIVPFLGGRHLTALTRNALAMSLAMFLVPWLRREGAGVTMEFSVVMPLLAKEVALGTIFGFLSSLAFYAASGVGNLVDNQRGMSMAQDADPMTGEQSSPLGSVMLQTLIMLFIATGGLALFFQAILTSYSFWSPFQFWPTWTNDPLRMLIVDNFGWYMTTIIVLAGPMMLVCFLVDFGMGLMNRFAPQMNVFFLAMPVKSALVMALMLLYWGGMFTVLNGEVLRLPVLWDALRKALELRV
jgi:type III secretion protein T